MPTYSGTASDDNWTVVNPTTFTLDGLGGTDTLYLGTSLRSSYTITRTASGAVQVDSISGASGALHATLLNMEVLVFDNKKDVLNLASHFGTATTLTGTAGNDTLTPAATVTAIDGAAGIDTVVLDHAASTCTLRTTASGYALDTSTATLSLTQVERLQFSDGHLALDLDGHAGQTAKLLGAVFGADSVKNPAAVGIGLQLLDGGLSYEALMQAALDLRLGVGASSTAVVTLLYTNLVGQPPPADGLAALVALLDNHSFTPATLGIAAAETTLNTDHVDLVGLASTGLVFSV